MECVPMIKDDFCYAKRYRVFASWGSSAFSANIYLESGIPGPLTQLQEKHPSDAGQVDFCDAAAKYRT
jgi:hypothetical protein